MGKTATQLNKEIADVLGGRGVREHQATVATALPFIDAQRAVADRRKPTLAERRAALEFREPSTEERRAVLASTLDDVSKSLG
jgi:hypothetical protein